ncbi:Uncharacterized protein APZ42_019079 [Daphnia magna]|uniref:ZP domain-containing protein n=1 Tax=Daphnia magna TaxID=35525 RepID=A0A164YN43_9CRUS|nr:Uncharacterized protein APZ42_019079 [Daphnia magna]
MSSKGFVTFTFILTLTVTPGWSQDYEVADVKCHLYGDAVAETTVFPYSEGTSKQKMVARLKKPEYFRGHPLFADDLKVNPYNDPYCSIVPEPDDKTGRIYRLIITDLSRCGVTHHGGYVHVRIWFPLLPGAMTSHDQEVILVCKPLESTILTHKVSELSSAAPRQARVSGVVEETSSKLEYQIDVYRYVDTSPYLTTQRQTPLPGASKTGATGPYLVPVDSAVSIGSRLQLRTNFNHQSVLKMVFSEVAWKYAKLVEVTVSTDPQDAHADGFVRLLHLGCVPLEMKSLMRCQVKRLPAKPSEIWLDFEAFFLAPTNYSLQSKKPKREGQQWIHTTVLACLKDEDCAPESCDDPDNPSGYGRRKRSSTVNKTSNEVQFDQRPIAIQIVVPKGEGDSSREVNCGIWIVPVGVLFSVAAASLLLLFITCRWNMQKKKQLSIMEIPPNFTPPQGNFH